MERLEDCRQKIEAKNLAVICPDRSARVHQKGKVVWCARYYFSHFDN